MNYTIPNMKTILMTGAVGCLFAFGAAAQDEADLAKWMKSTQAEMGVLRKIETKTGPDAAASAEKLAVNFDQIKTFWDKRGVEDASKWSVEAKSAALELSVAAKANDAEKAGAALRTIGGTCKSCHDAHRDKGADGSFKIK